MIVIVGNIVLELTCVVSVVTVVVVVFAHVADTHTPYMTLKCDLGPGVYARHFVATVAIQHVL